MAPSLPHSEEAERAVLASLLNRGDMVAPVREIVSPPDYYSEKHGAIHQAILKAHDNGGADLLTVQRYLEDAGELERVGGVAYLAGLDVELPDASRAPEYARIVKERAIRRRILELMAQWRRDAKRGNVEASELISGALKELDTLANQSPHRQPEMLSAAELLDLDYPEPEAVVAGLLYVGLTLLAARPKIGKSFLMLLVSLAVSGATSFFDGEVEHELGEVLYLALEDGPRRMTKRLKGLLGEAEPPEALTIATAWPRFDAGGFQQLRAWLANHPKARLVVIDTLAKVRARTAGKESVYALDYDSLADLQQLANRYNVAICAVTHTRKSPSEDFLDSVSGSTGLTGAADSVLVLDRARGEADAELNVTGRDVEEGSFALTFEKASGRWELLGKGEAYKLSKERREIYDFLAGLKGESCWPKELAEAIGKPERVGSVKHLLAKLREDGMVLHGTRGYYVPAGDVVPFRRPE